MKKLILITTILLSTIQLSADTTLGVRVSAPIGNGVVNIGFRTDNHRYDKRYKKFNYDRYGYTDDYGYYFGYFDRTGYFYNNIFFLYNNRYTYRDRLHRKGYFRPSHVHYRPYKYHKKNNWNKKHKFRKHNHPIYGHYYEKSYNNKVMKRNKR